MKDIYETINDLVLRAALKDKGSLLKPKYKRMWSEDNPLRGYCYLASEWVYHCVPFVSKDFTPRMLYVNNDETHWFLQCDKTGEIIDPTADQYPFPLDYKLATRRAFFKGSVQTTRGWISKNGQKFSKIDVE